MHSRGLLVFGLGILLSAPACALGVSVQVIQGTLSLNRGTGYVEVLTWADAQTGNQVMANPEGKGKIIYSDGCTIDVVPGAVYTVQESSPCVSGVSRPRAYYVIGGLAIAGGAVAIVALTGGDSSDNGKHKKKKRDNDHPASP